jgi:hypothetical protein
VENASIGYYFNEKVEVVLQFSDITSDDEKALWTPITDINAAPGETIRSINMNGGFSIKTTNSTTKIKKLNLDLSVTNNYYKPYT